MDIDAEQYLASLVSKYPSELHTFLERFRRLYARKLWHQLTLTIFEFLAHPMSLPYQVELFNSFIRQFEPKLNQLRLTEIGVKVAKQFQDPNDIISFLTTLRSRINETDSPAAYVLLLSSIAHAKLVFGDVVSTKVDLDACAKILDDLDGVEPAVHAAYYGVAADYYKAKADYAPYYKHSLLFLACVDPDTDLTSEERLIRAHDLGVSALLGDTIYNFGELLMHPILDALDGSPHDWIKELLFTFNEGNIGKFEALGPQLPREPLLAQNAAFLRQKICLMALIEAVFKRSADKRAMTFHTIAEETRLPHDEVEHLVMKAMSLKLIRGSLDQVGEVARITWVQPRVLSRKQIDRLADRLEGWSNKLAQVERFVETQGTEVFIV